MAEGLELDAGAAPPPRAANGPPPLKDSERAHRAGPVQFGATCARVLDGSCDGGSPGVEDEGSF
jgi:hypothetical protein